MRRLLVGAVVVVAACATIGSPLILVSDIYEYNDVVGINTLTFHWPRADLPVRVWVAPDSPLRADVDTAITRWEGAFLYGEFRATVVSDSTVADVIVRNDPSDIGGGLARQASACIGETDQNIDITTNTLQLPVHIFVSPAASQSGPGLAACYGVTVTHEFGHMLGIINPDHAGATISDVMFAHPVLDGLSDRDRLTAVTVYHLPSSLTLTGRR